MTPEQLSTLTALAGILKSIGTWPIMSLIVLALFGPWIVLVFLSINHYRRFETVVKMYEDNVVLVDRITRLADGLQNQLIWSTQTVSEANAIAKNNLFCPVSRKNTRPRDIDG